MRLLLALALAAAVAGCRGMLDGCVALCVYGPEAIKRANDRPAPDTSRTHCEGLAGSSWYAENGDRMTFSATQVDWQREGRTERRSWSCENDRHVFLGGFEQQWKGSLIFSSTSPRTFRLVNQEFRPAGTPERFPCEIVPGRMFFAENDESLEFLDAHTARWATPGAIRTVTWSCGPGEIRLRDGALEAKLGLPSHVKWLTWHEKNLQYLWAEDRRRPAFPCDVVAGSAWRVAGSDETVTFERATATHVLSGTPFTGAWSCSKGTIRIEGPGIRSVAELRDGALFIGSRRYDRVQP